MATRVFTKTVLVDKLIGEVEAVIPTIYSDIAVVDDVVTVYLTQEPTIEEDTLITETINAHVPSPTLHNYLIAYLSGEVDSFIKDLLDAEAATNIELGITQLGKTSHVLGLMCKQYDYDATGFPVSMAETFQFKSLYETAAVIQHIRDNPTEYDGLSPFITDARLLSIKNKVETFLGVDPLST